MKFRALLLTLAVAAPLGAQSDTVRLEIGSKEVDGNVYAPHAARVRVWVGGGPGVGRMRAEWLNVLRHGDSAGRKVHHWVTTGTQLAANGDTVRWELRQTYDAKTLQPYGIARTATNGVESAFRIDGQSVTGWRKVHKDSARRDVAYTLAVPGYVASASDLVPAAAGMRAGRILLAPIWGPNMTASEMRVFHVIGEEDIDVEGTKVRAWKVEERRQSDRAWLASWWLLDRKPYMVYGEVPLPDGSIQRMTEVEVPMPPRNSPNR